MVRLFQYGIALFAMAAAVNAEIWCQCKYADGSHCCVANGPSGFACTDGSVCGKYTQCNGAPESIAFLTYVGR